MYSNAAALNRKADCLRHAAEAEAKARVTRDQELRRSWNQCAISWRSLAEQLAWDLARSTSSVREERPQMS
jgi:kynureninase